MSENLQEENKTPPKAVDATQPKSKELRNNLREVAKKIDDCSSELAITTHNVESQKQTLQSLSDLSAKLEAKYAKLQLGIESTITTNAKLLNDYNSLDVMIGDISAKKTQADSTYLEIESHNKNIQKQYEENKSIRQKMELNVNKVSNLYREIFDPIPEKTRLTIDRGGFDNLQEQERDIETNAEGIDIYYKLNTTTAQSIESTIKAKKKEFEATIETKKNEFEAVIEDSNNQLTEQLEYLTEKIEKLLPGATAAGLASSYEQSKKTHLIEKWIWQAIFIGATIAMVFLAIFLFNKAIIKIDFTEFVQALVQSIKLLTFESPLIWLALLANKNVNQHNRLYEEYLHKWAMARSFIGMKKEFTEISKDNAKGRHIDKFANDFIEAVTLNPSNTLGRNDTDTPLDKVKDCVSDGVKCISKEMKSLFQEGEEQRDKSQKGE